MTSTTETGHTSPAHELNADPQYTQVGLELPAAGGPDDLVTACKIADYALTQLNLKVGGGVSGEIPSHHIELCVRLAELYVRMSDAALERERWNVSTTTTLEQLEVDRELAQAAQHVAADVDAVSPESTPNPELGSGWFALETAEAAVEATG